jgi:RNase P/RNase MRP subunit POP5
VQFDYEPNIITHCTPNETSSPVSKKRKLNKSDSHNSSNSSAIDEQAQINQITSTDIFRSLQDTLTQNYGIVGSSSTELSVRLYDPKVKLAIIKTSREKYPIVRSSLTFITKIKTIKVVATTICVSGSSRTARNAAWKEVQKRFFCKETAIEYGLLTCAETGNDTVSAKKARAAAKKALQELEARIEKIDSSC